MIHLFDYLFYRLYISFKKRGEEEVLGPSMFVGICLACLSVPICYAVFRAFSDVKDYAKWTIYGIAAICLLWPYIRYKRRKNKIMSQYQDSPYNKKVHIFFIYLMIPICTAIGVFLATLIDRYIIPII